MKANIAIIGAGPAGLFAALELAKKAKVLVIDKGKVVSKRACPESSLGYCLNCKLCDLLAGIGGAGAFSDGKLNLTPKIGGSPKNLDRNSKEVQKLIDRVESTFLTYGAEGKLKLDREGAEEMKLKAAEAGVEFIFGKQRHIGTERIREVIKRFAKDLEDKGVRFATRTEVSEISPIKGGFELKTSEGKIKARSIIASPGRTGAYWLREQARRLGIKYEYGPIDVGVRLEFPAEIYKPIQQIMYDAKFSLYTKTYDDWVRSFCANPNGWVIKEVYKDFVLVNGHSTRKKKSGRTNLALMSRIILTDPVEDTTEYGRSIASQATTLGGGKPLLQRYKDLSQGQRSTPGRIKKSRISPTLKDVTPGDISMALPSRTVINLKEALEKVNEVIPGIASDDTLIYAPEIKFYDTKYPITRWMETSCNNFYVAGDASGHSRGIVYSAITGILAAEGILKKQ